jgi:N-acylglucosamine 2-epimerase
MTPERLNHLLVTYRDGLLADTLPFWIRHGIDHEHGGYFTALDRDGARLSTDKAIWFQSRFAWLLSTLYQTVEKRSEWLELAKHGLEFLSRHGFDQDGRMYFWVTREGLPLRQRRYLFSEMFAVMAMAAYGSASGEGRYLEKALELFRLVLRYHTIPGLCPPKWNPETRPLRGLSMPMMLLATAQELRRATQDPICNQIIDQCLTEVEREFMKPDLRCLLETVGPNGEFIDSFDGRLVCPGHAIEVGWFILEEARHRQNDPRLATLGTTIIDWSFERGWDSRHGGVLYYVDAKGLPCSEYWHDMKFWWPHNEAVIATLLAWRLTGDAKYLRWHQAVHDWAYAHFPDPIHGEWFGYLHRDGTVSTRLKGNMWKGPFHLPRMQWYCWQRLEEAKAEMVTANP